MNESLKITLVQTHLNWENVEANIQHFDTILDDINEHTDVIVLPEMFSTGFSMNTSFAETMNGASIAWMKAKAAKLNTAICGSLMIHENENFYNKFVWMNADGSMNTYNKRHCFRMANEHDYFTPGNEKIIINYKGFNICPMVCYDLRFPVWSRNKVINNEYEYDLLLYVANWPERREYAWQQLLIARAIENQSYVVGVNRVGVDGLNVNYSGHTAAIDMLGQKLTSIPAHQNTTQTITIIKDDLMAYRKQFPAYLDADDFDLKI